jgi:hypothetical protein
MKNEGSTLYLVIELDQDDRTVNPVVEHAAWLHAADPGEVRSIEMALRLLHGDTRVSVSLDA